MDITDRGIPSAELFSAPSRGARLGGGSRSHWEKTMIIIAKKKQKRNCPWDFRSVVLNKMILFYFVFHKKHVQYKYFTMKDRSQLYIQDADITVETLDS